MDDNINTIFSFLTEEEVTNLNALYTEEMGKQAETSDDLLKQLTEDDINIISERVEGQIEKEAGQEVVQEVVQEVAPKDSIDKVAEQVQPMIDQLTETVYAEMQKDAGFASALTKGVAHVGKNAPSYLLGTAVAGGMWNQNRVNKGSEAARENLARMMAVETSADIATDQVFNNRDKFIIGRQQRSIGQIAENRAAVIALANIMKNQGISPEKVKKASFAKAIGKAGKFFGKAKKSVVKGKDSAVKTWKNATGTVGKGGPATKGVQTKARKSIAKGTALVAGGAVVGSALSDNKEG